MVITQGDGEGGSGEYVQLPSGEWTDTAGTPMDQGIGSAWWDAASNTWKVTTTSGESITYPASFLLPTLDELMKDPKEGLSDWELFEIFAPRDDVLSTMRTNRAVTLLGALAAMAAAPAIYSIIPKSPPKGTKKHPVTKEDLKAWEITEKGRADQFERMGDLVSKAAGTFAQHPILLAPLIYWLIEIGENFPRQSYNYKGQLTKPRGIYSGQFGDALQSATIGLTAVEAFKEFRQWI